MPIRSAGAYYRLSGLAIGTLPTVKQEDRNKEEKTTQLRQQMIDDMNIRELSEKIHKPHIRNVMHFAGFPLDHLRMRIVSPPPDREFATVAVWFKDNPELDCSLTLIYGKSYPKPNDAFFHRKTMQFYCGIDNRCCVSRWLGLCASD